MTRPITPGYQVYIDKAEEAKAAEANKDEKAKRKKRVDNQCFLLANYQDFQADIARLRSEVPEYRLRNIVTVKGHPSDVFNLVTPKGLKPFIDITPSQKSILQPYLRFFRIIKGPNQEAISSEEFRFRNHSAAGEVIETSAGRSTALERISKSGLGRIPDVGIKSFSYNLEGGWEQAHVPHTVKAKLQLYCNSLDGLLLNFAQTSADGKTEYPFGKTGQSPTPPALIDLVSYSSEVNTTAGFDCMDAVAGLQDNSKMEIHAQVGWSTPPESARTLFNTREEWEAFIEAVNKSRSTLVLTLVKSDIQMQENGSILLEAEYIGHIESIMANPQLGVFNSLLPSDIMFRRAFDPNYGKIGQSQKAKSITDVSDRIADESYTKFVNNSAIVSTSINLIKSYCDELKTVSSTSLRAEQIKRDVITIKEELLKFLREKFAEFDRGVRVKNQTKIIKQLMDERKLFYLDYSHEEYDAYVKGKLTGDPEERIAGLLFNKAKNDAGSNDNTSSAFTTYNKERNKSIEELRAKMQDKAKANDLEDVNKVVTKFVEDRKSDIPANHRRLSWFYLGDLIDLVLDNFYKKQKGYNKDVRFILGSYLGPSVGPNGTRELYDLANLPISFDLFIKWWTEHVVTPGRSDYPLKNFIKDLITTIIAPATGAGCLGDGIEAVATARANYSIFHAPRSFELQKGQVYGAGTMKELAEKYDNSKATILPEDLITYVYIYALDPNSGTRRPDLKEKDEAEGVYHLTYGLNKGIVRRIGFKRVDSRGRREALLEANNALHNLAQHSERYDATVEMIGNGIFRPGMTVYIDPYTATTIEHANKAVLSRILGFGGYFWIKGVETRFSPGKYETEVECIWTSPGNEIPGVGGSSSNVTRVTVPKGNITAKGVGGLDTSKVGTPAIIKNLGKNPRSKKK